LELEDEQYKPFWGPFWGLLGDSDLEGAYEYQPAHTDGGLRNFPLLAPSFIVPFFVWIYSFLSTVVLVNLLIAQMSSTYERVKENSAEFWEFHRVSLIREYKDNKDPLPPPFNVLWYLYIMLNRLCGKDERAHSRGFKWPRKRQGVPSLIFHLSDRGGGDLHIVGPTGTDAYMTNIRTFVNRRHPAQHVFEVAAEPNGNELDTHHGYAYSTAGDDPGPFAWAQAKTPGSGLEIISLPFSTHGKASTGTRQTRIPGKSRAGR